MKGSTYLNFRSFISHALLSYKTGFACLNKSNVHLKRLRVSKIATSSWQSSLILQFCINSETDESTKY